MIGGKWYDKKKHFILRYMIGIYETNDINNIRIYLKGKMCFIQPICHIGTILDRQERGVIDIYNIFIYIYIYIYICIYIYVYIYVCI